MKLGKIIGMGCFVVLLGGCTFGGAERMSTADLRLSERPFEVLKQGVKGEDTGTRIFWMGGVAEYGRAMDQLRSTAEIWKHGSRALVNVTEDRMTTNILGIVIRERLVLTADVVEFKDGPLVNLASDGRGTAGKTGGAPLPIISGEAAPR